MAISVCFLDLVHNFALYGIEKILIVVKSK